MGSKTNQKQKGSAVLLAAVSIIAVGTALVLAQLANIKSNTAATASSQSTISAAQQGAALAAAAGVDIVNNLTSSAVCSSNSGCGNGIYGLNVLSSGAYNQSSSWWTTASNVRSYSYSPLRNNVAYVIEQTSCAAPSVSLGNSLGGTATYDITARATANSTSSGLRNENIAWYYATANKDWPATTVMLYDYSCNAVSNTYASRTVSFTAGAAGNLSTWNSNTPYPAFSSSIANGTGYITQIDAGITAVNSGSTSVPITISVAGTQVYSATLTSSSASATSACTSGSNMSSYVLASPVVVKMGQTVSITFGTCVGSGGCRIQYNTVGQVPGNLSLTQMRYRVIGVQSCPASS